MVPMLKRHAIQVLRGAGHAQCAVAEAARVSIRTVRRVEREAAVVDLDDAAARQARRIGRPSAAISPPNENPDIPPRRPRDPVPGDRFVSKDQV